MATVTVRELSARTLDALKMRASANHRSLNGEILCIFDYAVSGSSEFDFIRENRARSQRDALKAVFGRWDDDRSEDEIVREVENSRTKGREVIL
ncbi:MAG: Arc family DNA-binding protein [Kiritimatiellae bacterium]|nr:Arc family DNA-binding protein [Kiritimatiellia bacterium]